MKGKQNLEIELYVESKTKPFYIGKVVKISPEGRWVYIEIKDGTKKMTKHNIVIKNDDKSDK